jgi:hypothetical protein
VPFIYGTFSQFGFLGVGGFSWVRFSEILLLSIFFRFSQQMFLCVSHIRPYFPFPFHPLSFDQHKNIEYGVGLQIMKLVNTQICFISLLLPLSNRTNLFFLQEELSNFTPILNYRLNYSKGKKGKDIPVTGREGP